MRPRLWQPAVALSPEEAAVLRRIQRAKLFIFLRQQRHVLFCADFQAELATALYADKPKGQPPIPPAQLALATILQASTGVSDDEVIEATTMDRRGPLVLDCFDSEEPPFSKATLQAFRRRLLAFRRRLLAFRRRLLAFRRRLLATDFDRRLIERTLEVARAHQGFSPRSLRAALDSSPLWGAGRVEDTVNVLGHALRTALSVIARQQGRGLAEVAAEAGAMLVGGPRSLKAALDLDWGDPAALPQALRAVLAALSAVEAWLNEPQASVAVDEPTVQASRDAAMQVREQDVALAADGTPTLRRGVSRDRRISIADSQMRHGRKSRAVRVDGDKRQVLQDRDRDRDRDRDSGLVCAVGLTAANAPEASVTAALDAALAAFQTIPLPVTAWAELHIDRAYLSSTWVRARPETLAISCKAWPVRNRSGRFPKTAFTLDWERQTIRCPQQIVLPFTLGGTVHFPAATCATCPLRDRCTPSLHGRSVHLHPDEALLVELRARQQTPLGRAKLRERVAVEHTLAHVGHWQGRRARYRGQRKNLFDLRRGAVVDNLHVLSHLPAFRLERQEAA